MTSDGSVKNTLQQCFKSSELGSLKYIIVTPVKDEAPYIKDTIKSVIGQTILPSIWIIRDDGSSDETTDIIEEYTSIYKWIKLIRSPGQGKRNTGYAEVVAFNLAYETIEHIEHDIVVKLDGDVRLPQDYFERLLNNMKNNPSLGILSGVYCEKNKGNWKTIKMPKYHTAGASKLYRQDCLRMIGGLTESLGWDSADEIKAMSMGWKTKHDPEAIFFHLKSEGTGMGLLRTSAIHGRIYYKTAGPLTFFIFKVLHRIFMGRPILFSGIYLLKGYTQALIDNEPIIISGKEKRFHHKLLNSRLFNRKI